MANIYTHTLLYLLAQSSKQVKTKKILQVFYASRENKTSPQAYFLEAS